MCLIVMSSIDCPTQNITKPWRLSGNKTYCSIYHKSMDFLVNKCQKGGLRFQNHTLFLNCGLFPHHYSQKDKFPSNWSQTFKSTSCEPSFQLNIY
jgi:hypothetical protein